MNLQYVRPPRLWSRRQAPPVQRAQRASAKALYDSTWYVPRTTAIQFIIHDFPNQSHMRDTSIWLPTAPAAPATERGFRGSAAPYIAPLCGPWTLCAPVGWWLEGGLGGGIQFEVDFADVSCAATKRQALRAVAQLPPRALCAPLVGAASADHTHRESGRQRASACCICAGTTAPGPSRYLAATHRQRRHLHSTLRVSTRAAKVCWGAGAHCGWVEGRERDARESSVEGLACSKK